MKMPMQQRLISASGNANDVNEHDRGPRCMPEKSTGEKCEMHPGVSVALRSSPELAAKQISE